MDTAEALVISRLNWSLFGTLTFLARDEGISSLRQRKAFFAWVRDLSKFFSVKSSSLHWVLRMERGETFGKEHLHCLIGAPLGSSNPGQRFWLMDRWEKLGNGMSRLFEYDSSLSGVGYTCKCLGMERTSSGGTSYELNKFGSADELILSHAAEWSLRKMARSRDGLKLYGGDLCRRR